MPAKVESSDDAALEARQRRMERRRASSRRAADAENDEAYEPDDSEEEQAPPPVKKRKTPLSQIRGIKKQARYEPEVPMSKEELAAWRKEARRVRNRESAAASRQKTRQRIEELEAQVDVLQSKYEVALRRIAELEQVKLHDNLPEPTKVLSSIKEDGTPNHVSPPLSPREATKEVMPSSPQWSLPHQQAAQALADSLSFGLDDVRQSPSPSSSILQQQPKQQQQHPVKISRPTAV